MDSIIFEPRYVGGQAVDYSVSLKFCRNRKLFACNVLVVIVSWSTLGV